VGAQGRDDLWGTDCGAAYLFEFDGSGWQEETKLLPVNIDEEAIGAFGKAVAIAGEYAIVGAAGSAGTNEGRAYAYGLNYSACGTTVNAYLSCQPCSGQLPLQTTMRVALANCFYDQYRRLAGRIDVDLAGGRHYSNWRSGYSNVGPGVVYRNQWGQNLPASSLLVGENVFTMLATDVTPSPYNQPPYLPAGDTDTSVITVTGMSP
jgi:hypothetical protein